jgi:hypothetical protein
MDAADIHTEIRSVCHGFISLEILGIILKPMRINPQKVRFLKTAVIVSRTKSFRRSAKTVFLHGVTGRCGGAEIQFPYFGTAVKPYPGETFRSADSALSNLKLWVKIPDFSKNSDVSVQLKSQIQS